MRKTNLTNAPSLPRSSVFILFYFLLYFLFYFLACAFFRRQLLCWFDAVHAIEVVLASILCCVVCVCVCVCPPPPPRHFLAFIIIIIILYSIFRYAVGSYMMRFFFLMKKKIVGRPSEPCRS